MTDNNNLGHLAYYDSLFSGLIPCKVIGMDNNGLLVAKVTAGRKAYKRGETITAPSTYIVPRKQVYTHCGQYRINTYYAWINTHNGMTAVRTKAL